MMTATATTIESLESARDAARNAADLHPHQAKVEAITSLIVKCKLQPAAQPMKAHRLERAKAGGVTLSPGTTNAAALEALSKARDALQAEQRGGVLKAQVALTAARRGAKSGAELEAAKAYEGL